MSFYIQHLTMEYSSKSKNGFIVNAANDNTIKLLQTHTLVTETSLQPDIETYYMPQLDLFELPVISRQCKELNMQNKPKNNNNSMHTTKDGR